MHLIDCDVHQAPPTRELWLQFLDEPYRSEVARWGLRSLRSGIRYEEGGNRWDASARTHNDVKTQLLDPYEHTYALLTGTYGEIAGIPDPEYVNALCRAYNDYTEQHWLRADSRYCMAVKVPLQDPLLAVKEIERWVGHPQVKAISFWGGAERLPFGHRYYWPIYEAANRHGIPIHVHPATTATIASAATSAAGPVSTYLQAHVALPQFYQAHLISLIFEGVFERFPNLRIAFVEGGFGWAPHVVWRMDKEFKGLRQQAPHLKRLPSQYVRDHIKFTTQPIEEPEKTEHLLQLIDMLGGPEMLMYASDFPHWDFDPPSVLPKRLGEDALRKILYANAASFFNMEVPADKAVAHS